MTKRNLDIFLRGIRFLLMSFICISLVYSLWLDYNVWQSVHRKNIGGVVFQRLFDLEKGHKKVSVEDLQKALQFFQSLIHVEPNLSDGRSLTGFCWYYLGQKDKALDAYLQAAEIGPSYISYFYNAGVIYFERGEYARALAMFRKAMSIDLKSNIRAFDQAKVFHFLLMKVDPSGASVTQRLKREYALAAYFAAICLEKFGDSSRAQRLRQQSLATQSIGSDMGKEPPIVIF